METEFIYWNHKTPAGVQVEEIFGAEDKALSVWKELALQVYGENGKDRFRVIDHTEIGAPLLEDIDQRISVSHTGRFLCVAQLPRTPEADLLEYSPRTAMGIDCEREDREQVLKVRERFLSERELGMIPAEDVEQNVLAWTCKEALYKAALIPGLDFRAAIDLIRLPQICEHPGPLKKDEATPFGEAVVTTPEGKKLEMSLYSYRSEGHIITIANSPKCAKYKS